MNAPQSHEALAKERAKAKREPEGVAGLCEALCDEPDCRHRVPEDLVGESADKSAGVAASVDAAGSAFSLTGVSIGYGSRTIVANCNLEIPQGKVTTIIGPNGCGKSTLLGALSAVNPYEGSILLNPGGHGVSVGQAQELSKMKRKDRARLVSLLAQSPSAPEGLTVAELVSRGRHPHQRWFARWSDADQAAIDWAMQSAGVSDLADRHLEALSGGQRQRAWIAMVLAQEAPIMLLDEPTTYLDISHSVEVLRLVRQVNDLSGATVVMVLHDLNLAIRSSDHLIVMKSGAVQATGRPSEVITPELLREVFDLDAMVGQCPVSGAPMVVPR